MAAAIITPRSFPPAVGVLLLGSLLGGCTPVQLRRGGYIDFIRPDQRPSLVGGSAATDSLYGPTSERGDGIADSRRPELEALVHRFAPSIVLPKGDFFEANGRKYWLVPSDPSLLTDTLRIDRISAAPYKLDDSLDISFRDLGSDSLAALVDISQRYQTDPDMLETWYFDFPGTTPRHWWGTYARLRTGPDSARWGEPVVFAHPFVEPLGRVVIQYWYFYAFNDQLGNHEGDWEHVNVIPTTDRTSIAEVDYYFHARSLVLPQGNYRPEVADSTHPVLHIGGRPYNVLDYPIRIIGGDHNEGSHGSFPYAGEWEGAEGLGTTESVVAADEDSPRVLPHERFRVVLTPEPSQMDYRKTPETVKQWAWLLLPVRFGFPSAPSFGSAIRLTDVGNRAPFGPAHNAGWNRTAPGLTYPSYQVRRLSFLRSAIEDLLQPWYYLYIFRHPRYVSDTRGALTREQSERLGLVPRGGWGERGLGGPLLGVHLGYIQGDSASRYNRSTGISLWQNFWGKIRFGAFELMGGYQRYSRRQAPGGSLFVYPVTGNVVLRGPEGLIRPYATIGGGAYGFESRVRIAPNTQAVTPGWALGWTASGGVEYYLRPKVAFDVAIRYHAAPGGAARDRLGGNGLHMVAVWIGHYVRF